MRYDAVDRTFYDAIKVGINRKSGGMTAFGAGGLYPPLIEPVKNNSCQI